ncbi:unnamed protein product [Leuciscus chuanchicus]
MFDSIKLGKLCKTHISPSVQAVPRPVCMMKFASHRRCYMWKSEAAPLPLPGLPEIQLAEPSGEIPEVPSIEQIVEEAQRLALEHSNEAVQLMEERRLNCPSVVCSPPCVFVSSFGWSSVSVDVPVVSPHPSTDHRAPSTEHRAPDHRSPCVTEPERLPLRVLVSGVEREAISRAHPEKELPH